MADSSYNWTPRAVELAEQIRDLTDQLMQETLPCDEGWSRILTDAVVVAARQEYSSGDATVNSVSVLPLDQQMPDWKATGLLRFAEQLYWQPGDDD